MSRQGPGLVVPLNLRHVAASIMLALCIVPCGQHSVDWGQTVLAASEQAATSTTGAIGTTEAALRETLVKYAAALESLDASAVKKVQPSVPGESLARAFRDMRELKVDMDAVRVISIDGTIARVSCRVTQTLTPKVGSRQTTAVTRVMRLRRDADSWVIDGFER